MSFSPKKLQKALQIANNLKVDYSIIIGEEELSSKKIVLKNMTSREQTTIDWNKSIDFIKQIWTQKNKREEKNV